MIPLVDIHCHILPAIDDGPPSEAEAVRMARIAWDDGIRSVIATCHQGGRWHGVAADQIAAAAARFAGRLREAGIALAIYPGAELALSLDLSDRLRSGSAMTLGNQRKYLLLEFPRGSSIDFADYVAELRALPITPILAHAERYEEFREDEERLRGLVGRGCLVQVNASSVCGGIGPAAQACIRRWVEKGLVHFVASDGHSAEHRPPRIAAAYDQVTAWAGAPTADRLCGLHGLAVLRGRPIVQASARRRPPSWLRSFLPPRSG